MNMPYPKMAVAKKSDLKIGEMTALDMVNPYESQLRQWVCTQLAKLAPNSVTVIASNKDETAIMFKEWTGYTQALLEEAWKKDGYRQATAADPVQPAWIRVTGVGTTTCCESLIKKLVEKINRTGFKNGKPSNANGTLSSFNLPGCVRDGLEPATTVGWHWYRDKSDALKPRPGDFFQAGTLRKPGQWSYAHVGVITDYWDDNKPTWITVEGGQGGPSAGWDAIKRNGPRPLDPMKKAKPHEVLMGWLDIDEFFAGWDQSNGS
jgi:hypothetical protein